MRPTAQGGREGCKPLLAAPGKGASKLHEQARFKADHLSSGVVQASHFQHSSLALKYIHESCMLQPPLTLRGAAAAPLSIAGIAHAPLSPSRRQDFHRFSAVFQTHSEMMLCTAAATVMARDLFQRLCGFNASFGGAAGSILTWRCACTRRNWTSSCSRCLWCVTRRC